ncbi:DUF5678 domain-containing protein [Zavarzinella formosa]|uniref:DUF5678 domain-containing protein n=1 Tax=Zavarzinella formosa TaxID=360055 RepID=UPI0002DA0513|nr:DUF5678 domain-containing protein [Zavarzinella formosa]
MSAATDPVFEVHLPDELLPKPGVISIPSIRIPGTSPVIEVRQPEPPPIKTENSMPELSRIKFEREQQAFLRLLPQLLESYQGQYVAIHDEQVVDNGPVRLDVAYRVQQRLGKGDIYVGFVSEKPDVQLE